MNSHSDRSCPMSPALTYQQRRNKSFTKRRGGIAKKAYEMVKPWNGDVELRMQLFNNRSGECWSFYSKCINQKEKAPIFEKIDTDRGTGPLPVFEQISDSMSLPSAHQNLIISCPPERGEVRPIPTKPGNIKAQMETSTDHKTANLRELFLSLQAYNSSRLKYIGKQDRESGSHINSAMQE